MRIGIDATALSIPVSCGTKVYAINLLKQLSLLNTPDEFILFGPSDITVPSGNFSLVSVSNKIPIFKKQFFLRLAVQNLGIDVFHLLDPFGPIFPIHPKVITTLHDTQLSQTYPWISRWCLNRFNCEVSRYGVLRYTNTVITDTDYIKSEAEKYLRRHNLKSRVKTVPLGVNSDIFNQSSRNACNKSNYFLAMGDFGDRKNIRNVLFAFQKYLQSKGLCSLELVVSSQKYESIYLSLLNQIEIPSNRLKMHFNLSNDQLARKYANAKAFIYPSLYEGFGMPIIESMACGCPVITSNFGAMKEVAGKAGILVNPLNYIDIYHAMKKIDGDDFFRTRHTSLGLKNSKRFSWKTTAQKTYEEYQRVFNQL